MCRSAGQWSPPRLAGRPALWGVLQPLHPGRLRHADHLTYDPGGENLYKQPWINNSILLKYIKQGYHCLVSIIFQTFSHFVLVKKKKSVVLGLNILLKKYKFTSVWCKVKIYWSNECGFQYVLKVNYMHLLDTCVACPSGYILWTTCL